MDNPTNNKNVVGGGAEYKEKIVEMIENTEKENVLGYLCRFIELFLEKWG